MTELTFDELETQMMRLYDAGNYTQAYELVQREANHFPEHTHNTYYWLMCLATRVNDMPQALQYFKDSLALGDWFAPRWLRDDEDLKPLQGLPEFEQMVAVCEQKRHEAQADARPELTVISPEGQTEPSSYPLFIALHGNGANARVTIDPHRWVNTQGWILAVPQSSQIAGVDAFVWDNDWNTARDEVQQHYETLLNYYPVDLERIILSGFSMGGGMAIWLAMNGAIKTRGFVVLGPYLRDVDTLVPLLGTAKAGGVRGYIIVGEHDKICLDISHKVHELLNEHGIPCELELRPNLGHSYPHDFEKSLEKGLAFVLQE